MRAVLWALLFTACVPRQERVALATIYAPAKEARAERLRSLVLVPGLLGSKLVDTTDGRVYWGEFFPPAPNPRENADDLRKLALPLTGDVEVADLDDELDPDGMLRAVVLHTGGKLKVDVYPGDLEGVLGFLLADRDADAAPDFEDVTPDTDKPVPYFALGYDWRRDLASETQRLDKLLRGAAALRQAEQGVGRVDVIAHSMGAVLVSWYLRYGTAPVPAEGLPELTWAGAELIDNLILVGPPLAGSPMMFEELVIGPRPVPGLARYPATLAATFVGAFELLPRVRHGTVVYTDDLSPVDIDDVALWRRYGWGAFAEAETGHLAALLPDLSSEGRVERMADHLQAVLLHARRFQAALDVPAVPPSHVRIHLFAGDALPTPSLLGVDRDTGALTWLEEAAGDGEVTRDSALMFDRPVGERGGELVGPVPWTSVHFVDGAHLSLTSDTDFLDDALYLLLHSPTPVTVRTGG